MDDQGNGGARTSFRGFRSPEEGRTTVWIEVVRTFTLATSTRKIYSRSLHLRFPSLFSISLSLHLPSGSISPCINMIYLYIVYLCPFHPCMCLYICVYVYCYIVDVSLALTGLPPVRSHQAHQIDACPLLPRRRFPRSIFVFDAKFPRW